MRDELLRSNDVVSRTSWNIGIFDYGLRFRHESSSLADSHLIVFADFLEARRDAIFKHAYSVIAHHVATVIFCPKIVFDPHLVQYKFRSMVFDSIISCSSLATFV